MSIKRIDVSARTEADPATVYALLRDGASWPTWSPITSFTLEQPAPAPSDGSGPAEPEGVGAIRCFRTKQAFGTTTSRERIVELRQDRRFSYTLLSGLPLRDYRANVDLEPTGTGTTIRWRSSFRPAIPGTGWLYRAILSAFIGRCARGLAEHAAKIAASGGTPGSRAQTGSGSDAAANTVSEAASGRG